MHPRGGGIFALQQVQAQTQAWTAYTTLGGIFEALGYIDGPAEVSLFSNPKGLNSSNDSLARRVLSEHPPKQCQYLFDLS